MNRPTPNPFMGELEVVATLSERVIHASISELRKRDELTVAMRAALRQGISIDTISDATGFRCEEIRRMCDGELNFGEDVAALAGLR